MQTDIPAFLALGIGGLLVWSAIKGKNPYTLLQETLSGKPVTDPRAAKGTATVAMPIPTVTPPSGSGGTVAA
jgi:hypothetical protein